MICLIFFIFIFIFLNLKLSSRIQYPSPWVRARHGQLFTDAYYIIMWFRAKNFLQFQQCMAGQYLIHNTLLHYAYDYKGYILD